MTRETPDLIQALVQEDTAFNADVFKRVFNTAIASKRRSTQPEERRNPNATNAPSRAKRAA
jgi:hypothetical protein